MFETSRPTGPRRDCSCAKRAPTGRCRSRRGSEESVMASPVQRRCFRLRTRPIRRRPLQRIHEVCQLPNAVHVLHVQTHDPRITSPLYRAFRCDPRGCATGHNPLASQQCQQKPTMIARSPKPKQVSECAFPKHRWAYCSRPGLNVGGGESAHFIYRKQARAGVPSGSALFSRQFA